MQGRGGLDSHGKVETNEVLVQGKSSHGVDGVKAKEANQSLHDHGVQKNGTTTDESVMMMVVPSGKLRTNTGQSGGTTSRSQCRRHIRLP